MSEADPIAIVGMACRFPGGAENPNSFWELLRNGVDAITEVPEERWNAARFHHPNPAAPGRMVSRWGGFVGNVDTFDAAFFGIAPREAARIDPQHRWLAEVTWEAIEDAGLAPEQLGGTRTGVLIGISYADYPTLHRRERLSIDGYVNIGSALSIAANRLSYLFNFRGPSIAVDTACSSSLVALHLGARSLWSGECEHVLVGGANALLTPEASIGLSQARMLSPRGRCRAFDAGADGYVRSEGAGAILLMRLSRARALDLKPRALLLATASNQDGRSSSLTVPNQQAQEEMIRQALGAARVDPADVVYVEAHGTGTAVGDRIEVRAVAEVLANGHARRAPLLLGSVKTNVGHLEPASGLAGLIKAVLVLEQQQVPPNLHFETPNPRLPLDRITVPTSLTRLPPGNGRSALVGVNSFGFGGTNAHALLAPAPADEALPLGPEPGRCLFPISARSPSALRSYAQTFAQFIQNHENSPVSLGSLCASAALGKSHHSIRRALLADSLADLRAQLLRMSESEDPMEPVTVAPKIAFVFGGQGSQWWAMGRELYRHDKVVSEVWHECATVCRGLGGPDIVAELLASEADSRLGRTDIAQPALFALQAGLVELWRRWGIEADFTIGHSVGEAAAAWASGIFSFEQILRVIIARGRSQQKLHGLGRMLAAGISAEEAGRWQQKFNGRVSIAAFNAPRQITLSGDVPALQEIAASLKNAQVFCRFLSSDYAFHSAQMDLVKNDLQRDLAGLTGRASARPMISSVTGKRIDGAQMDADYWWRNVRQPVQFARAVERALAEACTVFVEIGPHPVMASALTEIKLGAKSSALNVASLRRGERERETMLRGLAALYAHGANVRWQAFYTRPRVALRLPAYPWQRQRLWQESAATRRELRAPPSHPLLGDRQAHAQPTWISHLDARLIPWLADHRTAGSAVLPASAYLEMAAAAVREFLNEPTIFLGDVRFHRLLFLPNDQSIPICVRLNPGAASFQISAIPADMSGKWKLYAEGQFRPGRLQPPPPADLEAMRADLPEERPAQNLYRELSEMGQVYGPSFQGLTSLRLRGKDVALSSVVDQAERESNHYILFPPSFDSCLHSSVALKRDNGFDSRAVVIVSIRQLRIYRPLPALIWSHLRVVQRWENAHLGDVTIHDATGAVLAQVQGLKVRAIESDAAPKGGRKFYQLAWEQAPPEPTWSYTGGSVLVCCDEKGVGENVAAALRKRQIATTTLHRSEGGGRNGDTIGVDVTKDGWANQLWSAFATDGTLPQRVLYLWSWAEKLPGCGSFLSFIQGRLSADGSDKETRWVVATRRAQAVDPAEPLVPGPAALWGFVRTLQTEQPQWRVSLVDCTDESSIDQLIAELFAAEIEPEVALRKSGRWVRRLREFQIETTPAAPPPAFALYVAQPGQVDSIAYRGWPRSEPRRGQVEIQVAAVGLNFRDLMKVLGIYPLKEDESSTLGDEFSGTVARVGSGVRTFKQGDRVIGLVLSEGAFASHVVLPVERVWKLPAHLNFVEGASIPMVFGTAYHALYTLARLRAGETVLIHAAAGGVGLAAVQLAQRIGAVIIATAGNEQKRGYLRSLGVPLVLDSRTLDFADEILRFTDGRGVDVVLNSLAGAFQHKSLEICAPHGRFVEIGKRDLFERNPLPIAPFQRSLSFFTFDLAAVFASRSAGKAVLKRAFSIGFSTGQLKPIPTNVFSASETVPAFRLMQSAQQIGKIVLEFRPGEPLDVAAEFWPDPAGTYLITGGLSGLGLSTAKWLVQRGARHLALVSRSGSPSVKNALVIEEMRRQNVSVATIAADVADAGALAAALRRIKKSAPPLRGVFHAAMVLRDRSLGEMTNEQLDAVLAPKVAGAWNLHLQTRQLPLDCFVLYSSISSLLGTPAQANYAGANAFLDALAQHRRAEGLPAVSINWSQITDVGVAADRPELGRFLAGVGVNGLTSRDALALLSHLIISRDPQIGVMEVDWAKLGRVSTKFAVSPLFRELANEGKSAKAGDKSPGAWRENVLRLNPQEQVSTICGFIVEQVAATLGMPVSQVDHNQPLRGMDSLMAVELKVRIESQTASELPIDLFNAELSVTQLAERLLEQLQKTVPDTASAANASAFEKGTSGEISAPLLRKESTPLFDLVRDGKIPILAAAALMSWPDSLFEQTQVSSDALFERLNGGRVLFDLIFETPLGAVGIFMLPLRTSQVEPGELALLSHVLDGITQASVCGAQCVALTGLIASATSYGTVVEKACAGHSDLPALTTGHNTTIAAVILNLAALLREAGRDLQDETVMFYGIGSIGLGALCLMLDVLPHPTELHLCDPFRSQEFFVQLKERLRGEHGFEGPIRIMGADFAPDRYDASVIVGATNAANVLEVGRLAPGTLMVDDSAPHCLNGPAVLTRFREKHDVLCTEGGFVRSSVPMPRITHVPESVAHVLPAELPELFLSFLTPYDITACILSALLSAQKPELSPTIGLTIPGDARRHWTVLSELGFSAAKLNYEGTPLDPHDIALFRELFGKGAMATERLAAAV